MEIVIIIKKGFTLAEVLITLGIVGVVATITLPSVIKNYQKRQTVTQLKKAYTTLGEALKLSESEHGEISSWDLSQRGAFEEYVVPYLNKVSYCVDCNVSYTIKQINGSSANASTSSFYSKGSYIGIIVYLADGTIISTTESSSTSTSKNNFTTPLIPIAVDINGKKPPNKYGKDIFMMELNSKYGLREYGYGNYGDNWNRYLSYKNVQSGYAHSCSKDAKYGYWCFAKIILDGWQIKDDYPW